MLGSLDAANITCAGAQIGSTAASTFGTLNVTTGMYSQTAVLNNLFVSDLAVAPNGTIYLLTVPFKGSGAAEFATIDPVSGAVSNIAPDTVGLNSIAFSSDGTCMAPLTRRPAPTPSTASTRPPEPLFC